MKRTRWLRLTKESPQASNTESTFSSASVFSILFAAWFATAAPTAVAAPALQIWFVRHAESEINVPTRPHTVPDGGVSYPLTQTGVEQATALSQAMASAPVTTVYSSTYLRAIQTADAIAFRHGLTLSLAPEAIEIDLGLKRDSEDVREVYGELARK